MHARAATLQDAEAIAAIYNQAIEDGQSTFETRLRTEEDIHSWFDGLHPVVVVEVERHVVAYGATFPYRSRDCYRGVAEFSVYVDPHYRKRGAGRLALSALYEASEAAGFWKLVSRIFPENSAVRALNRSVGIREVGVYEKHGKLNGVWRDVIIVEWLIPSKLL